MPRLHGNEPCSYGHPQSPTAGDHKPTDREEEGPNWMACLFEEVPFQSTFNNNDIYAKSTNDGENFYAEPQESRTMEEEHEPKEKNIKILYKLNVNDNTDVTSTPHEEEYSDQNYEVIEDREKPCKYMNVLKMSLNKLY